MKKIGKILVVEDSNLLHKMYELIFSRYTKHGTSIIHAQNGQEALTLLEEHFDSDIILLDIHMPVMNGLEFLEQKRNIPKIASIPVIIISTAGDEENTISGLSLGAKAYIAKPFQATHLISIINEIIEGKN